MRETHEKLKGERREGHCRRCVLRPCQRKPKGVQELSLCTPRTHCGVALCYIGLVMAVCRQHFTTAAVNSAFAPGRLAAATPVCLFAVGNQELLNCYYAHADQEESGQVRHWARIRLTPARRLHLRAPIQPLPAIYPSS